jgi:dTMP kinase
MEKKFGLLIDLEGIDGSGKAVQSKLVYEWLQKSGYRVYIYKYPDLNGTVGAMLNDFLHRRLEIDERVQFLAFALDILKDQVEVRKRLVDGEIVILDRYVPSTLAYQCSKGIPLEEGIKIANSLEFLKPDLIFLLDIGVGTAMERKFYQKIVDRHEGDRKLLEQVRATYLKLYKKKWLGRWVLVDGEEEVLKISEKIEGYISPLLKR